MNAQKRFLIGGLGALAPVIMNLLVVDFNKFFLTPITQPQLIGYAVRILVLFSIGGFVAYLHSDEKKPVKVFELGIAAPALITALLNANSANANVQKNVGAVNGEAISSISLVSSAYAQPIRQRDTNFTLAQVVGGQGGWGAQFLQGFTGSIPPPSPPLSPSLPTPSSPVIVAPPPPPPPIVATPPPPPPLVLEESPDYKSVWSVIAGAYKNMEGARQQAQIINQRGNFLAEVHGPSEDSYYTVVIGDNLNRENAQSLRQKAIEAGFKDTYLEKSLR